MRTLKEILVEALINNKVKNVSEIDVNVFNKMVDSLDKTLSKNEKTFGIKEAIKKFNTSINTIDKFINLYGVCVDDCGEQLTKDDYTVLTRMNSKDDLNKLKYIREFIAALDNLFPNGELTELNQYKDCISEALVNNKANKADRSFNNDVYKKFVEMIKRQQKAQGQSDRDYISMVANNEKALCYRFWCDLRYLEDLKLYNSMCDKLDTDTLDRLKTNRYRGKFVDLPYYKEFAKAYSDIFNIDLSKYYEDEIDESLIHNKVEANTESKECIVAFEKWIENNLQKTFFGKQKDVDKYLERLNNEINLLFRYFNRAVFVTKSEMCNNLVNRYNKDHDFQNYYQETFEDSCHDKVKDEEYDELIKIIPCFKEFVTALENVGLQINWNWKV